MRGSFLLLFLLVSGSLCYGNAKNVEVVGIGECADCKENNIDTIHAVSGTLSLKSYPMQFVLISNIPYYKF